MTERNARVLLLGLDTDSEKGQALREILAEMDVEAVPISPAWKKEKVGDLAEGLARRSRSSRRRVFAHERVNRWAVRSVFERDGQKKCPGCL